MTLSPSTYRRFGNRARASAAAIGGGGGGGGTIVSDTFTRVGDTFTLGTADTGQVWAAFGGADRYTITANQANPFESITRFAGQVINAGTPNATVQFTETSTPGTAPGVIFRWIDANNYLIWWGPTPTSMSLSKVVAGVETTIGSDDVVPAPAAGVVYAVSCNAANLIVLKRNGVTIRTLTDATHSSGTRFGFGGPAGTANLYDGFTVTSP